MKTYMVVEHFKDGCFDAVYERFQTSGRLLPEGLVYLNSWVNDEQSICFQLMETDDFDLFNVWTNKWDDLVRFEIHAINTP